MQSDPALIRPKLASALIQSESLLTSAVNARFGTALHNATTAQVLHQPERNTRHQGAVQVISLVRVRIITEIAGCYIGTEVKHCQRSMKSLLQKNIQH